jgi:molecular chaperone DnaK (HSP70)
MVKEAEAAKENDKKRREVIDLKNESDTMVYNTEK